MTTLPLEFSNPAMARVIGSLDIDVSIILYTHSFDESAKVHIDIPDGDEIFSEGIRSFVKDRIKERL